MWKISPKRFGRATKNWGIFGGFWCFGGVLVILGLSVGCSFQLIEPRQDPFYRAIEASQSDHEAAVLGLGMDAYLGGQYELAEKHLGKFVKLRPDHALGWYYLASSRLEQRDFKSAATGFRRSLDLVKRKETMVGLFYAELYRGRDTTAADVLEDLKAWEGENGLTHRLEGELMFAKERYRESLSALRKSLELQPNQPDVNNRVRVIELILSE